MKTQALVFFWHFSLSKMYLPCQWQKGLYCILSNVFPISPGQKGCIFVCSQWVFSSNFSPLKHTLNFGTQWSMPHPLPPKIVPVSRRASTGWPLMTCRWTPWTAPSWPVTSCAATPLEAVPPIAKVLPAVISRPIPLS
jgi:hypothetical protein